MTSPLIQRERELWVEQAMLRPEWHYAEALFWVVHRDAHALATELTFGTSRLYREKTSVLEAVANLRAGDPGSFEIAPCAALKTELLAGRVKSMADTIEIIPGGVDRLIKAADWAHLKFLDFRPGYMGVTVLADMRKYVPQRDVYGDRGILANFRVDRATLIARLPPMSREPSRKGFDMMSDDNVRSAIAELQAAGEPLKQRAIGRIFAMRELGSDTHPQFGRRRDAYRNQAVRRWAHIERMAVPPSRP